jgi:hypothetical protein
MLELDIVYTIGFLENEFYKMTNNVHGWDFHLCCNLKNIFFQENNWN